MRFKLEIEMSGDAFYAEGGEGFAHGSEVRWILGELSREVSDAMDLRGYSCKVRDSNGNTVGFARVEED